MNRGGSTEKPANVFARFLARHKQDNPTSASEMVMVRGQIANMAGQLAELYLVTPAIADAAREAIARANGSQHLAEHASRVAQECLAEVKRRRLSTASSTLGNDAEV